MNDIKGAGGGKGGGGSTFSESENSLRSNVIVSTIEAFGEGPIVGLVNLGRSVYLDNTPLQNKDASYNFGGKVAVQVRNGLPVQDVVPGFEFTGDPVNVNVELTNASPIVRSILDPLASAIGLTISLPQGLYEQRTDNNSLIGAQVEMAVDVKLASDGAWTQQRLITYNDKTTSPYQETFRITRPSSPGAWEVRLRRLTADSASSTLRNNTFWAYHTELTDLSLTYPNVAYMALQLDAESVNSSTIPTRSAEVFGLIVEVPTNFDEKTRAYTGIWDGDFKNAWTDDPSWVLYALATNTTWGLGLDPAVVDKYSFYDASVYNSELLSYTNRAGVTSSAPRFSFNYQINEGALAPELLNMVAATMNAKVMWIGGQLTVQQDRPTEYTHIFTKANVIGGFKYSGTALQQRNTVCNVTWNDPSADYQQRVSSVEDTAAIARYGYNPVNIAAVGCTVEAQAIRKARWYLDTVLNQNDTVSFKTGAQGQLVIPGEVIRVWDDDYTQVAASGRCASTSTTTSVVLDRPIDGAVSLEIQFTDGTIETRTGTATAGVIPVSALPSAPNQDCIFLAYPLAISPRDFRVMKVTEDSRGIYSIEAGIYDEGKFSRVETGVSLPPKVFSDPRPTTVRAPTNLILTERVIYVDNKIQRSVTASWTASTSAVVPKYLVTYRTAGGLTQTTYTKTSFVELPNIEAGLLEVRVQAVSFKDVLSTALRGTLNIVAEETTGSALSPVTNLQVQGGGTSFTGRALNISFVNPAINGTLNVSASDFRVEVLTTDGTLLRAEYVPGVAAGSTQLYTYGYDANINDGGPRRSVKIRVYCRDGNKKLSAMTEATFSNTLPAMVTGATAVNGIGSVKVFWDASPDTDLAGYVVHRSTTSGFTPSAANLVAKQAGTLVSDSSLTTGETYYFRVAAYDSFGDTALNYSAELTAAPLSSAGIRNGATNPLTGTEGDLFFNTTTGKLLRWHAGEWTTAVNSEDLVANAVTAGKIAAAAVDTDQLKANCVVTDKLAAESVVAEKILAKTITANEIANSTITNALIVDSTIENAKIGKYLASDDFNGTITDGVMTAIGTQGWAIAKGDGTPGSGKMVIDAAEVRGTLNADNITVDGSFISNPGGVRNWDGWYAVSFDSTGLLDQHAGNMAGTAGTNPMYARLNGLGMASIPVINPTPPANGQNTAWNMQVSLTCRVFSSTPAYAAVVTRINDHEPDPGDIDASGDFANVVPMFNRTIDGSSGKTFRCTLPLPSWSMGSTDDLYLWISIQLLDSSGQPLSGFTATGHIGWEIHIDQLNFSI